MQMARPQCDTPLVAEECGWVGGRRGGFVTNVFVLVFFVLVNFCLEAKFVIFLTIYFD